MIIAGEASGDILAAELVQALRQEFANARPVITTDFQPLRTTFEPRFFGAGGPRMAGAGVELAFDMTKHSVVGIFDVIKNYFTFRRLFHELFRLALDRQPDVIICVDFGGFNRRFAHAIRQFVRPKSDWFHDWKPKLVQYVSPQVWASRQSRAYQIAHDYDLVLSIFPFEIEWYAKRVPRLPVVFVGHPILDRYGKIKGPARASASSQTLLFLPGSRPGELTRHIPVMLDAWVIIRRVIANLNARMVLPEEALVQQASKLGVPDTIKIQCGGLAEALMQADVAVASTGTVTMECALFGVPTVALYKTSWGNFVIAKNIVKVKYLAMPNLLANEEIFPEFIQHAAEGDTVAQATLELMRDDARRAKVKAKLSEIIASLGEPGANLRAAKAIMHLLDPATESRLQSAARADVQ
jgi:lipid-A-disaccharide synthase